MKEATASRLVIAFWLTAKLAVLVLPTLTAEPLGWLPTISVLGLYLLMGVLIVTARASLQNYNIDLASLVIFLLFGTVLWVNNSPGNLLIMTFRVMTWVMAGVILFGLVKGRVAATHLGKAPTMLLPIAVAAGLLLAVLEAYAIVHRAGFRPEPVVVSAYTSATYIARSIGYEASAAAVPEEFLFRGLLFGFLLRATSNEKTAYIVQGFAFWLSHLDRMLVSPVAFWLILPIVSAVLTLLTWRSRSLAPSIVAHTLFNTFQVVFAVAMMARM